MGGNPSPAETAEVLSALSSPPKAVLAFSYDAHLWPSQESLIHVLEESSPSLHLIALRDPYDAAFFPRAKGIAAIYGFSEPSIRVALRIAKGQLLCRGKSPVSVLGLEI